MPKKINNKNDRVSGDSVDAADAPEVLQGIDTKLALARRMIGRMRDELYALERVLSADAEEGVLEDVLNTAMHDEGQPISVTDSRVIEGVFDGEQMIGADGRTYVVPQNYASKSKLVEGDLLKLTIQSHGGFLFKQIGPIERDRLVGMLFRDENTQDWKVIADGKKYNVLPASVSYFKGQPSDQAVIFIPKAAPSRWAAIENIIHQE